MMLLNVLLLMRGYDKVMSSVLVTLDPRIKIFISVVGILGPLSIIGLIFLLKNIEKDNPDRIRWR